MGKRVAAAFFLLLLMRLAEAASPEYKAGYNPAKGRPHGIGEIPESAWGKEVKGLRSAISGPSEVRFNEDARVHILVRNISSKPVRVVFPTLSKHFNIMPERLGVGSGGYANYREHQGWEIAPGHEIAIPSPRIVFVRDGALAPKHARTDHEPGMHLIGPSLTNSREYWLTGDDGTRHLVGRVEGEWEGWLISGTHRLDLLDEDAELDILLPELGVGHGLRPSLEPPANVEFDFSREVRVRADLYIFASLAKNTYWLIDAGYDRRQVYWGPVDARSLRRSEVLKTLEARIRNDLKGTRTARNEALRDLVRLATMPRLMVELVYELVPEIGKPEARLRNGNDQLARTLRDRRIELNAMGLTKTTRKVLEVLTQHDPPLPPESDFKTIAPDANVADVPRDGWGSENEGLRAAALLPDQLIEGVAVETRLFIKNVSGQPVFMTVSLRSGYDHATAIGADGAPAKVFRHTIGQHFGSSTFMMGHGPEVDPGLITCYPPVARLEKLKLLPGAIWELETKTAIGFHREASKNDPSKLRFEPERTDKTPISISAIRTASHKANIIYELRTANGAEYAKGLEKRLWPARGGWSGLLETAPVEVELVPAKK